MRELEDPDELEDLQMILSLADDVDEEFMEDVTLEEAEEQLQNAGPLLNNTFTKRAGSFGSAVDERTRNNCMRVKCWVHIFSGSFGSAVEKIIWR